MARVCAFTGGAGTAADPYGIATVEQLVAIGADPNLLGKHFVLLNDLDLDPNLPGGRIFDRAVVASYYLYAGFKYVGTPFTGSFNGNGRTIKNLVIRAKPGYDLGLFGRIGEGGIVRDVQVEAVNIKGSGTEYGALAGSNRGQIISCRAEGGDVSHGIHVGGLVGVNAGDIVNCRADMDFVWGDQNTGGLVGTNYFEGRIVGCQAACKALYCRMSAGGLVGDNQGSIAGCYATGEVLGGEFATSFGGLVGTGGGAIVNSHASSNISTGWIGTSLGGLVGHLGGRVVNCHASGNITTRERCSAIGGLVGHNGGRVVNSYAVGMISVGADCADFGGLIGRNTRGEIKMSFWDLEASGLAESDGGTGLPTAQMQQAGTFRDAGWDFVGERNHGTADVWRMPEGGGYPLLTLASEGYTPPGLAGAGTIGDPYRIATAEDLGAMWRHNPSACYRLTSDIDLAGTTWVHPLVESFNGTLDGGGFVISHLTLHGQRWLTGLFGYLCPQAVVRDLGIEDANIVVGNRAWYLGVLAGGNHEGRVTRCYTTGRVTGGRGGWHLGGLVGANSGSITDCYIITDVHADEGSSYLGGLAGQSGGTVTHCYTAGRIVVPEPNETHGGLLGTLGKGTINNSYLLGPTDDGGRDNGAGVALTDAQMKQQASFAGWDFATIWMICEGKDYPRLRWEGIQCEE